jgi:thiamine biosynthesis lipoprotein
MPLIEEGRRLEEITGSLINPALGGLLEIWGFHRDDPENFRPPEIAALTALLQQKPSMADIKVDGFYLQCTNPAALLNFDSFLKGYAIDQAVLHLRELGIKNAMINAGGDLRAIGSRAGHPWHVTIRRPDGTGVLATLDLIGDESVVTVGSYEEYLTWKGTHYHHILDPRTGWPVDRTRSVTVIAEGAATAHAAATAMFVAGPDDWPGIAARMGVEQILLMDTGGTLHLTPQIGERLRFLEKMPPVITQDPRVGGNDPS